MRKSPFYLTIILLTTFTSIVAQQVSISRVSGPTTLNEHGRGLFADVMVIGNSVWATYQITDSLNHLFGSKNLWYKKFDRNLNMEQGQTYAINVYQDSVAFDGDLGDHQFTVMNDTFYVVTLVKGQSFTQVIAYDTLFNRLTNPVYIGDIATDAYPDMGIGNDGSNIYVQFYYKPTSSSPPNTWGAKIYKLNAVLNIVDTGIVLPESGSFVTGTSIVYIPNGQMGSTQDKLQIFSANNHSISTSTIGIHTFAATPALNIITGSTQDIIVEDRDTYWACGVSWNEKHQLWVVGYTKEATLNAFPGEEVGPSFIKIFDSGWNLIDSFSLNNGNNTFRMMTETIGDDIYVAYDEMNKGGTTNPSYCKIEHFKIMQPSLELVDSIKINQAQIWGGISSDGNLINITTMMNDFSNTKHIHLLKFDTTLTQVTNPVQITFNTDIPPGKSITDHKHLFINNEIFVSYSLTQDEDLYLLKVDTAGNRIGNLITVISNSTNPTNDMMLTTDSTYVYVLHFLPPSRQVIYTYDFNLNTVVPAMNTSATLPHNNLGGIVFRENQFNIFSANGFGHNTNLIVTKWDSIWQPIGSVPITLIPSVNGDGNFFASGCEFDRINNKWYIGFNHIESSSTIGNEHIDIAVFDTNFNLLENEHITGPASNRPHFLIKNGYLFMVYDAAGVFIHKYRIIGEQQQSCSVPTGISSSYITLSSARLNWLSVAESDYYQIRGRRLGNSNWTYITITNSLSSYKDVYGLTYNNSYEWQIKSLCNTSGSDSSTWSLLDTFTTACFAPDSNWTDPIISNAARLNWSQVFGTEGYEIRGRRIGGSWVNLLVAGGNTIYKDVYGLISANSYEWKVRAICNQSQNINSDYTSLTNFTTITSQKLNAAHLDELANCFAAVQVFPNPANDKVVLRLPSGKYFDKYVKVCLLNMAGHKVMEEYFTCQDRNCIIDLIDIPTGLYNLILTEDEIQVLKKIVIID